MEATSSRTGRPSGSSDISSDAWLCVGLRIIRKYKKLLQPSISLQDYRSGPRKRSISWNPFSPCAKGAIATAETLFFDPADAVSDPKKVRIRGNPTRFSLFFFDPADAVSDPKKVHIWGNPTRFFLFFERKKGRRRAVCSLTKVNARAIRRQRWGLQQAILRLQYIE